MHNKLSVDFGLVQLIHGGDYLGLEATKVHFDRLYLIRVENLILSLNPRAVRIGILKLRWLLTTSFSFLKVGLELKVFIILILGLRGGNCPNSFQWTSLSVGTAPLRLWTVAHLHNGVEKESLGLWVLMIELL